jgi:hypothetical protein
MVKGDVPGLESLTGKVLVVVCLIVPKLRLFGLKLTSGLITVAENVTNFGLPGELEETLTVAEGVPTFPA